ncbi:MAG: hypothetical protein GX111_06235 [Clostridiales bacterium]|nr:hypothetical protein [Clostridiales bacterium]
MDSLNPLKQLLFEAAERTVAMIKRTDETFKDICAALIETEARAKTYQSLTREQTGIIDTDDTDRLIENIRKRQSVIDEINKLQEKVKPYLQLHNQVKFQAEKNDIRTAEIENLLQSIRAILADTQKIDIQNRKAAMTKMNLYGSKARQVSISRKSIKRYNGDEFFSDPVFFDDRK